MKTLLAIWRFYLEGFRGMTTGRVLWAIILVKLFVMFCILKVFFFPNFLRHLPSDSAKGDYVAGELVERALPPGRGEGRDDY